VALKIIKLGMDTQQVIARFEAERQALAMMEHPNIAKVLDAGATERGRPYFVMELVRGIPITEYCDKNNLDTRQRLELFIDVCKAVQHAHQKGIIHRDIKPTNVLITLRDDGTGVPKIIDFGIAKATQQRLTEKTYFTEFKQFVGTPEYMSPEQTQMGEVDVDTRSDIYSLGVLLYELLAGTTPFDRERLRSSAYDEMLKTIQETEPPKPSTRLNTLGDGLADVAKHRHAESAELCKLLRGDLDWIVMKALEKDRTRRYETTNELAMDIERHLRDEPVVAGPPGAAYRLRKFMRRNRRAVSVGLLVVAALLIGFSLAVIGFVREGRARARAEEQRERAEASLKLAREAVDEMTRAADEQLSVAPAGPRARRLLQQAQVFYGRVLEERSDDPAAREQAGLAYRRLAAIHEVLGEYGQSEQAYHNSIEVFEKLAEDFPETAMNNVHIVETMNKWDSSLEAHGRHKEAAEIRTARCEKVKGLFRRFPHNSLYRKVLVEECRRQGSRQFYEDAIAWFEDILASHPSCRYELAMLLVYFGTFLEDDGRLEEADEAYLRAEIIRREQVAMLPRLACETRRLHMPWPSNRGLLCLADYKVRITQVGEYQLYVRSARHDGLSNSIYAWIEELADGPGGTIADWYMYTIYHTYASFTKDWDEEGFFERVQLRLRDSVPSVWQIAAPGDYTITLAAREDGVAIDAFVFQLASLPAPEAKGPGESERTEEMVFIERDGRVVAEAEHFADRTPSECTWLVVPGEDAGDTAHINFRGAGYVQALPDRSPSEGQWQILTDRGGTQLELGHWDEAIADYSEALALMPDYLPALIERGEAYAESGQWDKAIADYSKVIADRSIAIELDPNNWGHWRGRAEVYFAMKQWDQALADFSRAIELDPNTSHHWHRRGDTYSSMKQLDKAIADFSKAIELNQSNPDHWHRRADVYSNMQQWDKALADFSKAIELNPDDWGCWCSRADVYSNTKQWDKGISDFSKAVELASAPGADVEKRRIVAHIYRRLGDVLEEAGRVEDAQEARQKAEEIEKEVEPEKTEDN
jgi:tetratricopeptide (TPR) repeat protein